jgi:hypothetical protein
MTEQIDQFFNPDGTLISIPVKLDKVDDELIEMIKAPIRP